MVFFARALPRSQAGGGRTSAEPGEGGGLARCNRRRRSLPFAVRAHASEPAGMVVAVVAACAVVIALGLFLLVGRPSCVEAARAPRVLGEEGEGEIGGGEGRESADAGKAGGRTEGVEEDPDLRAWLPFLGCGAVLAAGLCSWMMGMEGGYFFGTTWEFVRDDVG